MELLLSRWADAFARFHPAVVIELDSRGSQAALNALGRAGADFVALSRQPSAGEFHLERGFPEPLVVRVGWDTLRVFGRGGVERKSLDFAGAYSGRGGEVRPFGRNLSSGTRAEVQSLLGASLREDVRSLPSPGRLAEALAADPKAIGYGGGGWSLARVSPIGAALKARPLVLVFPSRELTPISREFLSFVLSGEGRDLLVESGFASDPDDTLAALRTRLALQAREPPRSLEKR